MSDIRLEVPEYNSTIQMQICEFLMDRRVSFTLTYDVSVCNIYVNRLPEREVNILYNKFVANNNDTELLYLPVEDADAIPFYSLPELMRLYNLELAKKD